ncbi:MAG: hypothetical protein ACQGVC_12225 [Myxococcota bacterium]
MSSLARARVAGTLLLLVAAWPLVHRQLVVHQDVDPWKLYGFAMYCTPHSVAVDLIDRSGPRAREIGRRELPPALRDSFDRFVARRSTLGRFVSPEPLAREVLDAFPEVRTLSVAVSVSSLPFGGDSLERRTTFHRFDRP